jgi:hypothetical protein
MIPILYLRGDTYYCGHCGESFKKDVHTTYQGDGEVGSQSSPPIYQAPEPGIEKERERRHGIGYNTLFIGFRPTEVNMRSSFSAPSTIKINTAHPEYKSMLKGGGSKKTVALEFRNYSLMFSEIVNHSSVGTEERLVEKDRMFCIFSDFYAQKKDKDKAFAEALKKEVE